MFVPSLDQMLVNISETIPQLIALTTAISYVLGLYIIVTSIAGMRNAPIIHSAGQGQTSMWTHIKHVFVGSALIYFPSTVHEGTATLFGTSSPYAYIIDSSSEFADVYKAVLKVCVLVGAIAVIKGIYELGYGQGHSSQEKGHTGSFAKACMHLIAGVLLINVQAFLATVFTTLGITLS